MRKEEILSKAKPILFNGDMVNAILNGQKTVTRRIMKGLPSCNEVKSFADGTFKTGVYDEEHNQLKRIKPIESPFHAGDYLYVRETWREIEDGKYEYRADGKRGGVKWKPSIFMPKSAARIFLVVNSVRAGKLHTMEYLDFHNEGIEIRPEAYNDPDNAFLQMQRAFQYLWDSTVDKSQLELYGWDADPWVWVISFSKVTL